MPFSLAGQDSQVSWAYNWGSAESSSSFNPALEYIPMLWSNNSDLTNAWPTNAQKAIDAGSTALLGFNEPDLCIGGSACMDVASSVKAWKAYMQPFAGKALLGSPAVTNGGAPYGLTWLSNFIDQCTGCQIDFIVIHWYSNKWAGANYFKSQVEAARQVANGRPIWVTEFGLDYSDGTYTDADVQAFLEEVMPWMDEQSDVHRYAYFMDTNNMLMNSAGTGMSDTGAIYNNYTEVSSSSTSSSSQAAVPSTSSFSSESVIAGSTSAYGSSRSTSVYSSPVPTISSSKTLATTTSTKASSSSTKSALSTSKSSSTTTAAATPSAGIQILSAYFADANVTTAARTAFLQKGNLVVNTYALTSALGISDPWWGTVKTLSILYSYNNAVYVFTAAEQTGTYTITPSSIPSSAKVPGFARTHGATVDIVACVWGNTQVKTQSVFDRLDYQQSTGWGFQVNTGLFGVDGFWGHAKVGIIWYRDAKGTLKSLVARENGWVKF